MNEFLHEVTVYFCGKNGNEILNWGNGVRRGTCLWHKVNRSVKLIRYLIAMNVQTLKELYSAKYGSSIPRSIPRLSQSKWIFQ